MLNKRCLLIILWTVSYGGPFFVFSNSSDEISREKIQGKWKVSQFILGKPTINIRDFQKNGKVLIHNAFRGKSNQIIKDYTIEKGKLFIGLSFDKNTEIRPSDYELIFKLTKKDLWLQRVYQLKGRWFKGPLMHYKRIEK